MQDSPSSSEPCSPRSTYDTITLGTSARSPTIHALVTEAAGVTATLLVVASVVLVTVPLALALRTALAAPETA